MFIPKGAVMATRKPAAIAKFRQSVDVELFRPRIKLLASFRYLDVEALSRTARADVPIGEVDGGCCGHTVYARVRRGSVIGIRTEPCDDEKGAPLSRDYRKLVTQAFKRASIARRSTRRLPLPVRTFFGSAAVALQTSIDVMVCVRICILGFCTTCCRVISVPNSAIICGKVTIDTTKPGLLSA
jgi:hypothetical protein